MYSSTSAGCRYFVDDLARHLAQLALVLDTTDFLVTPFECPRPLGFTISGKRELLRQPLLARCASPGSSGVRMPCVRTMRLASALSSETRERGRVRPGVRDVEQLEQRRHLRLAVAPLEPLGDVEDHVDRRRGELRCGSSLVASSVDHLVPVATGDRLADGLQRLRRVVLGLLVAARRSAWA